MTTKPVRHVRSIAEALAPCEAYDFSRDLAIEGFFRFTARAAQPGLHAETHDVIVGVNPTERERAEPVVVDGGGARDARTITTSVPFSDTASRAHAATVTAHWHDQIAKGGETVALSGHGVAGAASRRAQS